MNTIRVNKKSIKLLVLVSILTITVGLFPTFQVHAGRYSGDFIVERTSQQGFNVIIILQGDAYQKAKTPAGAVIYANKIADEVMSLFFYDLDALEDVEEFLGFNPAAKVAKTSLKAGLLQFFLRTLRTARYYPNGIQIIGSNKPARWWEPAIEWTVTGW